MSYAQLYQATLQVKHALDHAGVNCGDRVALGMSKNCRTVAAVIGILACGASYVALDMQAPVARLEAILQDSQAAALLLDKDRPALQHCARAIISVDAIFADTAAQVRPTPDALTPEHDAYVLYTSGSTGVPNGVRISHRAMLAFFQAVNVYMALGNDARCMNTSALYFDVSVVDLLLPLYQGATLWLGPEMPMPQRFLHLLQSQRITHFSAVGATLAMLASQTDFAAASWPHIRRIMTGAEVLNPSVMQAWLAHAPNATLLNGYGPTEVTCVCTVFPITRENAALYDSYPIGVPLPGVEVMLDEESNSELCLAGPQILNGYLNRPELNADRLFEKDGKRFYRTGDKAAWRTDGGLDFLGRIDDQIKLRGYRIHLEDVAQAFRTQSGVREAVAAPLRHERHGECLAVILQADDGVDLAHLRTLAAERLPPYMKPKFIGMMRELPLKASGKADLRCIRERAAAIFGDAETEIAHEPIDLGGWRT